MDEKATYTAFGKAIADRRVALDLTQQHVAARAGLSRASLANIERGAQRVYLHQILALSEALDLDSAHEIMPERAVKLSTDVRAGVTMSGASSLSKDQRQLVNRIVTTIAGEKRVTR
jgi:transcriptional regulator with XRE-family HTH domain